jgi:hypothetical protein
MTDAPSNSGSPPPSAAPAKPDGGAAPKDAAHAAPAQPVVPRKVRLALDGDQEQDYDVDAIKANYLKGKNSAQLMSKADQRLREATEKEKRAASMGERLKSRDETEKLLTELGIDPEQFAEALLVPRIQQRMMTEEQRAAHTNQQRAEAAEAKLKAIEDERLAKEDDAKVFEHQGRIGKLCVEAMTALNYPVDSAPALIPFIAKIIETAAEAGHDISPSDAADYVDGILNTTMERAVERMSGEQLAKKFPGLAAKIQGHNLALWKERQKGLSQPAAPGATTATTHTNGAPKRRYLSESEWDAEMKKRIQEG